MTTFYIPGMHCGSCEDRIKGALEAAGLKYHLLPGKMLVVSEDNSDTVEKLLILNGFPPGKEPPSLKLHLLKIALGTLVYAFYALAGPQLMLATGILGTAATLWIGKDTFKSAYYSLKSGYLNMDALFTLSSLVALAASAFHFCHFGHAVMILTLRVLGILLKDAIGNRIGQAFSHRKKLPALVTLESGEEINLAAVTDQHTIRLKPGDIIPVDGEIMNQPTPVNKKAWTGVDIFEILPAGTKVRQGMSVQIETLLKVDQVATESSLVKFELAAWKIANTKEVTKPAYLRAEGYFVSFILGLAVTAALWGLYTQTPLAALNIFMTVLVSACPCALTYAKECFDFIVAIKLKNIGFLVRSERLANFRDMTMAIFDLNGTLTRPVVATHSTSLTEAEFLSIAAGLEVNSQHPIARAIVRYAREKDIPLTNTQHTHKKKHGIYNNDYVIGDQFMMGGLAAPYVEQQQGSRFIFLAQRNPAQILGYFVVPNDLDPSAHALFTALKAQKIQINICTGSKLEQAEGIMRPLNGLFDNLAVDYQADKPKVSYVRNQGKNQTVCFIGDGENDLDAIAAADYGIMMGHGPIDTPHDATFTAATLGNLLTAHTLSKTGELLTHIVIGVAAVYILFSLAWAAGVIAPFGYALSPTLGALLMAMESTGVMGSAGLWWIWPTPTTTPVFTPSVQLPLTPSRFESVASISDYAWPDVPREQSPCCGS